MKITWFNLKLAEGQASLNENSITLNKIAMSPFEGAYRVKVGMDEKNNIIIQPLSKDYISHMNLNENDYLGIQITKSYARINSKELMSLVSSCLKLNLGKEAIKYPTKYNENEDHLVILTGKGE